MPFHQFSFRHPLLKVIFLVYKLILLPLSQASLMDERSHLIIVSSIKITIGQQQYKGWKHPPKNYPQDSQLISGPYHGDREESALIEKLLELCTWPCFKHYPSAMIIYLFLQTIPNIAGHALVLKRKRWSGAHLDSCWQLLNVAPSIAKFSWEERYHL